MKVKIGPYLTWWGPYQIADLVFGNPEKYVDEKDETWRHRASDRLGDWLADTWVADFCQWVYDKRKRQVYVHIDNYDVWNMDETLKHIIGPMLKRLKQIKHGSGFVDDEDVPEHLRSTAPGARDGCENDWDSDNNLHRRYDWLLDELIWVFTTDHEEAQHGFYDFSKVDKNKGIDTQVKQMQVDREALDQYQARMQNAYRLFGKYYQTFWD